MTHRPEVLSEAGRQMGGFEPFLAVLGESPELRVLHELVVNPEHEYTKVDLASGANVARVTLDKVLDKFLNHGLVEKARTVGHITLYRLNEKNQLVQEFVQFNDRLSLRVAEAEAAKAAYAAAN